MLVFLALTSFVVYCGVEKGIERFSKLIMPGLIFSDHRDRAVFPDIELYG